MGFDLRAWIDAVDGLGELKRINGADWDLEIGVLAELFAERLGPALLFDEIHGYRKGERILSNPLVTPKRFAFTMGVDDDAAPLEMVRQLKNKLRALQPCKVIEVKDGPVLENVSEGENVDLFRFPAPKWHERDGGRYIGTGGVVILRDPDTGWVNAAPYRVQVHERNLAGIYMSPSNHGSAIRNKYWSKGQKCPVAVVVGEHPLILAAAALRLPLGASELEAAGGLAGEPLPVLRTASGIPIPAQAEIVLEGEMPRLEERSHPEGPFGEFTGYYTWSHERAPVIEVKRVMWRNDPILLGASPMRPPTGERLYDYLHTAQLWQRMVERETPGLVAVWIIPAGVSGYLTVIAIKQQYEGHARDVASIAIQAGGLGRFVIVVDDDIDPSNEQEVLWALATRCEPQDAVQIVSNCRSAVLDPLIPRKKKSMAKELQSSRGVLIACRPYSWRDRFPLVNRFSEEKRKAVLEKWAHYL